MYEEGLILIDHGIYIDGGGRGNECVAALTELPDSTPDLGVLLNAISLRGSFGLLACLI